MRRASVLLALVFVACATTRTVSDRLFCGLSIPTGGSVTQQDLDAFIEQAVTPRFPQGFTVWRAKGQWKGGNEEVMILEFLHPNEPGASQKVAEIAAEYRRRFHQEAVLRVTVPAQMELEQ
ncbi:MAG TPA: DUF3574 domain-containing protein [Thermoanaerobaculia bacterium]|nr:DUF3574 domain-containing protein [Thermoanaerobaculia bacterium]